MPRWIVPVVALALLALLVYEATATSLLDDLNLPPYAIIVVLIGLALAIGAVWAVLAAIRGRGRG